MSVAVILALFGWYVIYSNKEVHGKPHLTSWHSWIGVAALLSWVGLALVGLAALHPDFGSMKRNKSVRFLHKWLGRLATASGWGACLLGFIKMDSDASHQALFALPLAVASAFVLV